MKQEGHNMNLLNAIFGRCAEDVEYYSRTGYPHALCVDHEDALHVALQTATGRYKMTNTDMFVSPPYREFECPGYIVLKDEEAAAGIQQEILRSGFECTRAKSGVIQPLPKYF